MSLKVWLPLNGALDNQGLDDVIVTNSGATIDNSGKIGKCYIFDGSNDYLYFPYSFPNEDWSYSIWFYTTATTTQTLGCCRNGIGFGFSVFLISNTLRIDGVIGQKSIQWTTSYTFPTNVWVNLIITSKNGLIKYYINGEYQSSNTVARDISKLGTIFSIGASQTNGSGWGNFFEGKINDVRIYDHALSPLEVKQISQGLILHYLLNNNNNNINNNIEYDCSGYCNNGTKIGDFQYSEDTPKYNYSTYFKATNQKIHIDNLNTTGFSDSYSFAWWGKESSVASMFWGFSDGIRLNGLYQGTLWNTGDGNNNPIYEPNTTIKITAPLINVWHHYVMVGDKTICKLYIDGQLYGQAKTYKSINGTSIYINGWNSTTQYSHNNMYMSDFRIYTTALSAKDIKSLYNNSAYIDNQGNIYSAIYKEV